METPPTLDSDAREPLYDVVVVGGAIAGASTAILLKRQMPHLRVLVVEKTERFDWKVGESTTEISAYFLTRVLKQYDYLSRSQLPKQGFRYWFSNGSVKDLRGASEVGTRELVRTPTFQLDRAKLDEHLLAVAGEEGSEVWRPVRVTDVKLGGDSGNIVTVERDHGTKQQVRCRWIVDATGRHAMLARKRGGVTPIESHPTSAIWVRYLGVKDLDGVEVAGTDPAEPYARGVIASRRLATNHFMGWGHWIWFIPLKDGETSVGLVWDKRLVKVEGTTPLDRLTRFLSSNPLTRELLEHATPVEGDCRSYGHLPYFVDQYIGPGWTCVGDAGGFLDPFYSPGLDQMSYSVHSRVALMRQALGGRPTDEMARAYDEHNRCYDRFFHLFYESIFRDKYYAMGDYDTMTAAFLLDTSLYYLASVLPVYRLSSDRLGFPPYFQDGTQIGFPPIRFYNRRLASIARRKKLLGIYGNHNAGRRPAFPGFSVGVATFLMLAHGLLRWWKAEFSNAWTYVRRPRPLERFSEPVGSVVELATAEPLTPS